MRTRRLREIAILGMNGGDNILSGIGLHIYQDSFSHAGYGSQFGHLLAGHEPDYPYNDVQKALRAAQGTFDLLKQWQDKNCPCDEVKSFDDIKSTLGRLLALPGDTDQRANRWQAQIRQDFGMEVTYGPLVGTLEAFESAAKTVFE